ncbi:hypothetical protein D3218_00315 [Aureimonas flava]|uniref:Uncharacterized protein n=1 Tax=Aureimonas flava TaxID=2320271 RepID=A0A3A1WQ97_9HYPH|nr:hypothetical protein D3218_00315 [Aureimonas flava]
MAEGEVLPAVVDVGILVLRHRQLVGRAGARLFRELVVRLEAADRRLAALGRLDGHMQPTTTMWDAAAGAVLCREAGMEVFLARGDRHLGVWAGLTEIMAVVRPDPAP